MQNSQADPSATVNVARRRRVAELCCSASDDLAEVGSSRHDDDQSEITARVAFEFKPENYPAGFTPDEALALELEQAAQDPHEYLALPGTSTAVEGRPIADGTHVDSAAP
jgi:hypothetical protein